MFSYEFYKVFHLICLFSWICTIGYACGKQSYRKSTMALMGVTSFFALVGGMGLLARLGVKHLGPWPHWAYAKLGIWVLISFLTHIIIKRVQKFYAGLMIATLLLAGLGAYYAIYKG